MEAETRISPTMTQQKSLKIMAHMIATTQQKLDRNDSKPLLLWGYLSLGVTLLVYLCLRSGGGFFIPWLWLAIPLIGIPTSILLDRKQTAIATASSDRITHQIWMLFGGILGILPLILIVTGHNEWILRLEMLFLSTGIATNGLSCQFRPFTTGGLLSMILSGTLFISLPHEAELGIMALIFILTLIIPGHLLRKPKNHV